MQHFLQGSWVCVSFLSWKIWSLYLVLPRIWFAFELSLCVMTHDGYTLIGISHTWADSWAVSKILSWKIWSLYHLLLPRIWFVFELPWCVMTHDGYALIGVSHTWADVLSLNSHTRCRHPLPNNLGQMRENPM